MNIQFAGKWKLPQAMDMQNESSESRLFLLSLYSVWYYFIVRCRYSLCQNKLYGVPGVCGYGVHRWCKLLRHEKLSRIVVVIVEAVGATDFSSFKECFPFLVDKFPMASLLWTCSCVFANF